MNDTSYGEKLCRELLNHWFPDKQVIYNYRPAWLKNPKTGRNLELDIFYPTLKLAVEFNGPQHQFLIQRRKDYFKKRHCIQEGVVLINIEKPLDLFKCKGVIRRHTGIKTKSGASNKELLWKLRMYDTIDPPQSPWYEKAKEESLLAEADKISKKQEKRRLKLLLRRELRHSIKMLTDRKVSTNKI